MASNGTVPPPVTWAQRYNLLYIIIEVECKDIEHNVTEKTFQFKGVNALDANIKYDVTLNFLHSVDPTKVSSKNIGRCMEFTIYKKEAGPFWPSLTAEKKLHFLKANFIKWKNESDDEEEDTKGPEFDFSSPAGPFGNFDDLGDDDSDDNIPSLSNMDDEDDEDEKQEASDKTAKVSDK